MANFCERGNGDNCIEEKTKENYARINACQYSLHKMIENTRTEVIRASAGVSNIIENIREARMRWRERPRKI